MTTNTEAVINVECLYEDYDFYHVLKRDEYETIIKRSIRDIEDLLAGAASHCKNSGFVLHSVERVGGGTRIPIIEDLIASVFSIKTISKTLDANESVARGCAIMAAVMSPLFKVASYKVSEKLMVPI